MFPVPKRICIIGPSSSGKSTLAEKLGIMCHYPVLHLDQIAHIPGTKWQRCSIEETIQKHDAFIQQERWIVEGNYAVFMPQRLDRADMVIFFHFNRFGCLYRFIRRTLAKHPNRAGMLEGGIESINWGMIRYILFSAPKKKNKKYAVLLAQYPHLTIIHLHSFQEVNAFLDKIKKTSTDSACLSH